MDLIWNPEIQSDLQPTSASVTDFAVTVGEFLLSEYDGNLTSSFGNNTFFKGNLSTQDSNNSTKKHPHYNQYKEEQLVFQIFLFLFIIIGNTSVLLAIGLSKRGRSSRMNFFIMHLALADLSVGVFSVLTDIIWKITKVWYAGNAMCKIVRYMQSVAMYASTYVLVALSLDRLDAIARPMSFSGSSLRAKFLIVASWFFSFVFSVPMLIINKETEMFGSMQCWINFTEGWHWQLYISLIATALFFVPALIITICYSVIIHIIWSKSKMLQPPKRVASFKMGNAKRFSYKNGRSSVMNGDSTTGSFKKSTPSSSSSSRGVIPLAKVKTIKMTLLIVLLFILCWSPYFIYDILDVFGIIPMSQTKLTVSIFIQSLAPLNSVANPLIYGIFSSRLCSNLRQIRICNYLVTRLCKCCVDELQPERPTSVYSTYSTLGPESTTRRHIRNPHAETRTEASTVIKRRPSGPPCIHKTLTESETNILMSNLNPREDAMQSSTECMPHTSL